MKENLGFLKKQRRALESEKEGCAYRLESQLEKNSELQSRIDIQAASRENSVKQDSERLSGVKKELTLRYGIQQLDLDKQRVEKKYNEKLAKILEDTRKFQADQVREYEEKIRALDNSIAKLEEKTEVVHGEDEQLQKGLKTLEKQILDLETEMDELSSRFKEMGYQQADNKGRIQEALCHVRVMAKIYYDLASQHEMVIEEKVYLLQSLNQAKEMLSKDAKSKPIKRHLKFEDDTEPLRRRNMLDDDEGNSMLSGLETEGEQDSIVLEEELMEEELFPGLVEDIISRNLKLEGWLFADKITVTNTGAHRIVLERETTTLQMKKSGVEFVFPEDVDLGPGEHCLVRRVDTETGEKAVTVFDWNTGDLGKHHVDELFLLRKGTKVSKTLIVNHWYYNRILSANPIDVATEDVEIEEESERNKKCRIL